MSIPPLPLNLFGYVDEEAGIRLLDAVSAVSLLGYVVEESGLFYLDQVRIVLDERGDDS